MPPRKSHKCGSCFKIISRKAEKLKCEGECKKLFHFQCVNTTGIDLDIHNKNISNWKCDECCGPNSNYSISNSGEMAEVEREKQNDAVDDLLSKVESINLHEDQKQSHAESKDHILIPDWLDHCESPFLWHTQQKRGLGTKSVIFKCKEKLEEIDISEPDFSVQRFVSRLKLVLEYYVLGQMESAWSNMTTVENLFEESMKSDDPSYKKIKVSLGHVVSATKAFLLALDGQEDKSKKMAKYIVPVKVMTATHKAALYAMKARFILYSGYENGEVVAVDLARKALKLEPDISEWQYILAKLLRQNPKDALYSAEIPQEELELLQSTVSKNERPKYLMYLGMVYRKCGSQAFKNYSNKPGFYSSDLNKTIISMQTKAFNYYKQALAEAPDNPKVLRSVGSGIMDLPKDITDYKLVLQCLQRSLEIVENTFNLRTLGMFYHRYENDNQKALEYFEKSAKMDSYAGLGDMIRVKYIMDPNYDPCEDLESGLKWAKKEKNKISLVIQLGAYFLLLKRDFVKSLHYFNQVIKKRKKKKYCSKMAEFRGLFLRMYDTPINLYHYLYNEALLILMKHSSDSEDNDFPSSNEGSLSPADLRLVKDFIDKLIKIDPKLVGIDLDSTLIDRLQKSSKDIAARESNQRNKQSCQRTNYRNRTRTEGNQGFIRENQSGSWRVDRNDHGGSSFNRRRDDWEGQHKAPPSNNIERSGRFSTANQRNVDSSADSQEENGIFQRGNQAHREPSNEDHQGQGRSGNYSRGSNRQQRRDLVYDWRKK